MHLIFGGPMSFEQLYEEGVRYAQSIGEGHFKVFEEALLEVRRNVVLEGVDHLVLQSRSVQDGGKCGPGHSASDQVTDAINPINRGDIFYAD